MAPLYPISPLDGRYGKRLDHLTAYFSEFALMRERCRVELLYVKALNETGLFPALSEDEVQRIDRVLANFSDDDYARIKAIESTTRHDVKACEFFLREQLDLTTNNVIHFGLTSEDANNLAYNLMLKVDRMSNGQCTTCSLFQLNIGMMYTTSQYLVTGM